MLVRQWIHVLCQSWVLLVVVTHLLRQGGTSDPEVYLVPLSNRGLEKRAEVDASIGLPWYLHV